jgi:hypothetical protein
MSMCSHITKDFKLKGEDNVEYSCIVNDERLSLEDRVAFACTYMDDEKALRWLKVM